MFPGRIVSSQLMEVIKYHFSGYISNTENVYAVTLGDESNNKTPRCQLCFRI